MPAYKGYRGHDAPKPLRVLLSGQKRGGHGQIKRELRRRSAIEATISHMKTDGHLGRSFLKGRHGDQANAELTAVGYKRETARRTEKPSITRLSSLVPFARPLWSHLALTGWVDRTSGCPEIRNPSAQRQRPSALRSPQPP